MKKSFFWIFVINREVTLQKVYWTLSKLLQYLCKYWFLKIYFKFVCDVHEMPILVSISPTFFAWLFSYVSFAQSFFVLAILVSAIFGHKCAHKILVKLTTGVNFTNINCAFLSHQSCTSSFYAFKFQACMWLV